MTNELGLHMKSYPSKFLLLMSFAIAATVNEAFAADVGGGLVKANLVQDKKIVSLIKAAAATMTSSESDIESKQIIELKYSQNSVRYIVPIRRNTGTNRGCYVFNFDEKLHTAQQVLLAGLEELESCETIAAIFPCNRDKSPASGLAVLYAKSLGATQQWFEGSYLTIGQSGLLSESTELSEKLTDVDRASIGKKKLACR